MLMNSGKANKTNIVVFAEKKTLFREIPFNGITMAGLSEVDLIAWVLPNQLLLHLEMEN